jgi:hypothetical protein
MGGPQHARFWDLGCMPHIINIAGEHLNLPAATKFVRNLASLMSYSCNARHVWADTTGATFKMYSATRWYSLQQTGAHITENFAHLQAFLRQCDTAGYGMSAFCIDCRSVFFFLLQWTALNGCPFCASVDGCSACLWIYFRFTIMYLPCCRGQDDPQAHGGNAHT